MQRSAVLATAMIVLLIATLAANARIPTLSAQIDPVVATAVQQRLDATATAAAQFGTTQTIEAAFNQALTATAAFNLTVEAALNQAVQATYAAMYVASNNAWIPVIRGFDGVSMVQVPPGCFMMGLSDADIDVLLQRFNSPIARTFGPQHQQCFDEPFWIDMTEVTLADFERLGGVRAYANYFSGDQLPVENIGWSEARDFCVLRGGRLPTEAEWEYAARGPDGLLYPWGNNWNRDNAVWGGNSNGQTANVGSRPAGASWVGAYDLSGNVSEWVSSLYEPYPYNADDGREADTGSEADVQRVIRGGAFTGYDSVYVLLSTHRFGVSFGNHLIGFRCVRSLAS